MTFSNLRAVLFDLDGTLIDSAPDLAGAANALRFEHGLAPLPLAQLRPWVGAGARGMLGVGMDIHPTHANYDALKERFLTLYAKRLLQDTRPFDGIPQLLQALTARGLAWGIVTNKAERFTLPIQQGMPLLHGAGAVIGGDTTPHPKPHPAPLLEAARRLGIGADECLYVGDDHRDIQAAHAAGMPAVAACWGYMGASPVADWGADAEIERPEHLLPLLG